jgi:hypothetical protein
MELAVSVNRPNDSEAAEQPMIVGNGLSGSNEMSVTLMTTALRIPRAMRPRSMANSTTSKDESASFQKVSNFYGCSGVHKCVIDVNCLERRAVTRFVPTSIQRCTGGRSFKLY